MTILVSHHAVPPHFTAKLRPWAQLHCKSKQHFNGLTETDPHRDENRAFSDAFTILPLQKSITTNLISN